MTKTIEHIKDRIQFYKTSKANYAKECIKHPNNKTFEEAEKLCEELIQINEQIKCELEAWEICKNKLNLKVQTEEAVTEGFCMKGYWLLVEQYPYTQTTIIEQEEYKILKKVLEVEDE